MVNYLMTLGWAPAGDTEIVPWQHIVDTFRLEDVNHSPAFFDIQKLQAFNGEYIRKMPLEVFIAECEPFLTGEAMPWPAGNFKQDIFRGMAELVQTRVTALTEVPAMVDFFFLEEPAIDDASWAKATKDEWASAVLSETTAAYATAEWNHDSLKAVIERVGEKHGLKLGKVQAPIRVAITGRTVGPPLFESLELLGRETTLARLAAATQRLAK